MKWHEFVFSNRPQQRIKRHILFWLAWWIYFSGSFFYNQLEHAGEGLLHGLAIMFSKSLILLLGHLFLCYVVAYFLLSNLFFKKKYISFSGGLIAAMLINIAWSYFSLAYLFPLMVSHVDLSSAIIRYELSWMSITSGILSALKVLLALISIRLLKSWYLKQKENEKTEKEKLNLDLQLLKAQIHPDILFSSLDTIYFYALNKNSVKASILLLKLSELLSYILYESDKAFVPLNKELKMIKDYLLLIKMSTNRSIEIDISVKGEENDKVIIPLILLPLLENIMSYCLDKNLEKSWLNLSVTIVGDELTLKIVNGKLPQRDGSLPTQESSLKNVQRRLDAYYFNRSNIRLHLEQEIMVTTLYIKLDESTSINTGSLTEQNYAFTNAT